MYQQKDYNIRLSDIANGLDKVRWRGDNKITACCPAHDDKTPSFVATEKDGKILLKCFSGCSQGDVIDALKDKGLWHAATAAQKQAQAKRELNKKIRLNQTLLLIEEAKSNNGYQHSKSELVQINRAKEFLRVHGHG